VCERARLCLHLRPCLCLCDAWRAARAGLHRLPLPAARRHDGVFQQVRALLCATRRCAGAPGGSHSASARVAVSRAPPIGLPSDWFAHKLESIVGKACCARLYAWQDYVFYQKNPIMPSIYVIFVGTGFTVFAMVCALPSRCIAPPRHPSRTVWAWRGFARPLSSRARALSPFHAHCLPLSLSRPRSRSLADSGCVLLALAVLARARASIPVRLSVHSLWRRARVGHIVLPQDQRLLARGPLRRRVLRQSCFRPWVPCPYTLKPSAPYAQHSAPHTLHLRPCALQPKS